MEIERKFKLKDPILVPGAYELVTKKFIWQFYITDKQSEIRLRQEKEYPYLSDEVGSNYILTIKSLNKGAVREELNVLLSQEQGEALKHSSMVRSYLTKHRTSWRPKYNNFNCSIDVDIFEPESVIEDPYTGERLFGLVEVEFENLEDSKNFVPFHWMGQEVTNDIKYRSSSLAKSIFNLPLFF